MPPTKSSEKIRDVPHSVEGGTLDDFWARMQARVWRPPVDRQAVRERLLALTPLLRQHLRESRQLATEWSPLGIEVKPVKMRARGLCSASGRVVYVNSDDRYELQRFTIAHEVGHLLLSGPAPRRRPLSPQDEEFLCEEFAGRLLIDQAILASELTPLGGAPDPESLLRLCGRFRVNIRPMQIAVGEHLADSPYAVLLARRRGHWRRPAELAFRVDSLSGARHSYLPRHQRLASLGLTALDASAERARHGTVCEGSDPSVRVGLRGLDAEQSSATTRGAVGWRAIVQGNNSPFLLAVLDLRLLPRAPWRTRERAEHLRL